MVHRRSFSEFFTDMKTDANATRFVKILLLIEILFNIIAGFLLLIWFRVNAPPLADIAPAQLALVILIIAHLGTPLTLVDMLNKLENRQGVPWLSMWWLIVATLLDVHSIIDAFLFPYATTVVDGGYVTYLKAAGFIFLSTSVCAIIAYLWVKLSNADMQPLSDELEGPKSAIMDDSSYNTVAAVAPGVVSVRFPTTSTTTTTKFVHQPARKGD
jgi:hypothetical protein